MRYGYIGYVQLLKGQRLIKAKIIKHKKPDEKVELSKQIKSLMKTALFNTNESMWRLCKIPTGIIKQPPARPKGIELAPTLLATRLSEIFYTADAKYLLKHWDELDTDKFVHLGTVAKKYGASWQPIYDLHADDPKVHLKLIKRLLKVLGYTPADNFSTVFCFALIGMKKYKDLVAECPELLRPYLCLVPTTLKEHEVAIKWATKRKFIRVAFNAILFSKPTKKTPKKLEKSLKSAFKEVKGTWTHYYGGTFVPLCMVNMERIGLLHNLAKRTNVVITDFDPIEEYRKLRR